MKTRNYYCETLKPGFYLIPGDRCIYCTGTKKGNKWVSLFQLKPYHQVQFSTPIQFRGLQWNCIFPEDIAESIYSTSNPTPFPINI